MENLINEKPCIVAAKQGFTILYKEKLLYSKYDPCKVINQTISNLNVQEGTIILCNSPALFYGFKELINKIPQNCFLIFCEFDASLNSFSRDYLTQYLQNNSLNNKNYAFPTVNELYNLPQIINKKNYIFNDNQQLLPAGSYRRFISLDFSAGVQFQQDLYKQLFDACNSALMTYWSNRVTLTKFGRKYSSNLFTNLTTLKESTPINNYFNSITKPIIVFGAGESTDDGISKIKSNYKDYYILCADTALQPLITNGIIPDGVFIEEAQHVISKAFIGTQKFDFQIFAGITSLPLLNSQFPKNRISYFFTEYTDAEFILNLKKKNLLPPENPPFGSVGLTTVYYALKFRKDDSIPVFLYGLDFSYSAGKTHAKDTLAHKNKLLMNTKIECVDNLGAAYSPSAQKFLDKENHLFFTTLILRKYSDLFNSIFSNTKNLFDSSHSGIKLSIPQKEPYTLNNNVQSVNIPRKSFDSVLLDVYLSEEINTLKTIRAILTGEIKLTEDEAKEKITELVEPREYLYLHFPDGTQFSYNLSFLKRIRTEIDYFLKKIEK